MRSRMLRDSAYTFAARVWMALARGACIVAISQVLGPHDYGVYALVLNTFVVMVLVGTAGLEQANTYLVGKNPGRLGPLVVNAAWSSAGLGIAIALVFVPIVRACAGWLFEPQSIALIQESMLFVPLAILNNQLAGIVVGCSRFRYYAGAEALKWGVYLGASLLLWGAGQLTARTGLLAFYGAVASTGLLHAAVLGTRHVRRRGLAPWPQRDLFLQGLAYGGQAFAVNLVNLLNFRFDLYLLRWLRSPADVGIYSLGVNLAEVLLYFARSLNVVVFARVASDARRSATVTPAAARFGMAIVTAATLIVLLFKDGAVVRILGDAYAACSNVVTLLLPGIMAQTLTLLLVGDLLGRKDLAVVLRSGVLCFATMVLLDLVTIPSGGALAAAAASTVAYSVQCAYLLARHAAANGQETASYLLLRRADLLLLRRRLQRA